MFLQMMGRVTLCWGCLVVCGWSAEEPVDWALITRIRQEEFMHSKVMETLSQLCDAIGPRLTGSPQLKKANEWTKDQLQNWGMSNAHLESWGPFGRGWSLQHFSIHMLSPDAAPLIAFPKAWTEGTHGAVSAEASKISVQAETDFDKYRGKLNGFIVFNGDAREVKGHDQAELRRYSEQQLGELSLYAIPPPRRPEERDEYLKRERFQKAFRKFLVDEKALALVEPSPGDGGTVFVTRGGSYQPEELVGIPSLTMAAEHYNRIVRLLDHKSKVQLEIDISCSFHDADLMAYNTLAEIPGTDKKDEVVMLGAHMDSWHSGTGATDNAAGTAVTMEAMRILRALDVKPRRTIRIALWTGEEQGLKGSRAYVNQHFASRPEPTDPEEKEMPLSLRKDPGPLTVKPEHAKLSAYFNVDNGTGKIRGVYLQDNTAVHPIFEAWLKPFADLGASTLTMRNTGGTDHLSFDAVGLPGFQFIQDEVEYGSRTHHSNMDVYDRLQSDDLMKASVIVASFVYHTATRDALIPRKPIPTEALP